MSSKKIILLTERQVDQDFFNALAKENGFELQVVTTVKEFVPAVVAQPKNIVVWDADHPNGSDPQHPYSLNSVRFVLTKTIAPTHCFAITDKPINLYSDDQNFAFLSTYPQHNLIRSYDTISQQIYGRLISRVWDGDVLTFSKFFPENATSQAITIRQAEHRKAAVEAVQNLLSKDRIEKRLAAKVAQAADELLMNAIFDAPKDSQGKAVRQHVPRTAQFTLAPGKEVDFQFVMSEHYGGVCVTDPYGTVDTFEVARYLRENYKEKSYKPRAYAEGAGLGLYMIVQGGLSLVLACEENKRTAAMIFFRNTKSFKTFREGFHFTACLKL